MSPPEQLSHLDQLRPTSEVITDHAPTAVVLGLVAIAAHKVQVYGLMEELPELLRAAGNSLKHLVLGYVGGVSCSILAARESRRVRALCIAGGAIVFNYAGEVAQTYISPVSEYSNFTDVHNMPETAKGLGFAFLAAGFFAARERRFRKKSEDTKTKLA